MSSPTVTAKRRPETIASVADTVFDYDLIERW